MKPSKGAGVVYNDNEVGLPTVFALAAPYLSSTRHGQHFSKMLVANFSKRGAMLLESYLPVSAGFHIERGDKK